MTLAALAWAALAVAAAPDPSAAAAASDDDGPLIVDGPPPTRASAWSATGRATLLGAADASREGAEDALETFAAVDLGLRWEPSPRWDLELAGRLAHHLGIRPGAARGGLAPELFTARLTWRASDALEVDAGLVSDLRWPTLVDPQPADLALGPLPATGDPRDRRRPIPVVRPTLVLGPCRLEALWQPLFVAPRVPLRGSDWAPLVTPLTTADDVGDLAHPSGLDGSVVGLRASVADGVLEAGLAWLWRWDPTPGPRGFERQHVVGLALATATGPLHWRFELAWQGARTVWMPALVSDRRPALEAALALSAAPFIFLDGELTLRAVHLLGEPLPGGPDVRALGAGPSDVDLGLRLGLLMAFDGVLRLDLEGRRALLRADGDLALALAVRLGSRVEAALGLTLFGGEAMDGGRGALYDADDQLWVRVVVEL